MTTTVTLQTINVRRDRETARVIHSTYLNIQPDFQREFASWDGKLKTRLIETILLNRAMNPIWTIYNKESKSEEVLDGMHRLKTSLSYLNDEFSLNSKFFHSIDKKKYANKKFSKLSEDDQQKIRNYNFTFNQLDSSYREDANKRRDMYEILNRSNKTLNEYEFNKVLYNDFYKIISQGLEKIKKINFFPTFSEKSEKRGIIDNEIIDIIILSENQKNSWSSISNLRSEWYKTNLGDNIEKVEEYVEENKEKIVEKIDYLLKLIFDIKKLDFFKTNKKDYKSYYCVYKFFISRLIYHTKNSYTLYKRHEKDLITNFSSDIYGEINIFKKLECQNRNAIFQQKLMKFIDDFIIKTLDKDNIINFRRFPKDMIELKLEQQKGVCNICNETIKENDDYEADHIKSWSSGGLTIIENLQVLHKRCHQTK